MNNKTLLRVSDFIADALPKLPLPENVSSPSDLSRTDFVRIRSLRVATCVIAVVMFIINGVASSGVLGGLSTGQVSDLYPSPIVPQGLAFSIWGLIYTFLAVNIVGGLFPSTYSLDTYNQALNVYLPINFVLNTLWIILWQVPKEPISSFIVIFLMLSTLVIMYSGLHRYQIKGESWKEYLFVRLPVSTYTGWLVGAVILNFFAAVKLYPSENSTESELLALAQGGIAALVLDGFIGIAIIVIRYDPIISFVGTWTTYNIYKNPSKQIPDEVRTAAVTIGSILLAAGILCWVYNLYRIWQTKRNGGVNGNQLKAVEDDGNQLKAVEDASEA